jgi:hypothetical protein
MRATLVVGGFLAKVPRLTPVRVVALRAAMLGAVVALGLLLAIPAVVMAADINKTVSVDATQEDWQDTGIFLRAGDHVVIDGSGTVDLDKNTPNYDNTPPDGDVAETATSNFLLPGANVGALIGKIDNGDPFVVGDLLTIDSVASSGELFLAVNDSFFGFTDNSGHFTADIAVNHPELVVNLGSGNNTYDERRCPPDGDETVSGRLGNDVLRLQLCGDTQGEPATPDTDSDADVGNGNRGADRVRVDDGDIQDTASGDAGSNDRCVGDLDVGDTQASVDNPPVGPGGGTGGEQDVGDTLDDSCETIVWEEGFTFYDAS